MLRLRNLSKFIARMKMSVIVDNFMTLTIFWSLNIDNLGGGGEEVEERYFFQSGHELSTISTNIHKYQGYSWKYPKKVKKVRIFFFILKNNKNYNLIYLFIYKRGDNII